MSYLPIDDDEMLPGRPGKTSLFFRLRNNPLGMFAGDDEAPKLAVNAHPVPAYAGYFLRGAYAAFDSNTLAESETITLVPQTTDMEYDADRGFRYACHRPGVYAVKTRAKINPPVLRDGDIWVHVYKNGSPFGTLRTVHSDNGAIATGEWVEALTLAAGDVIELYGNYTIQGSLSHEDPAFVEWAWGIGSDQPYNFYLTRILEIF